MGMMSMTTLPPRSKRKQDDLPQLVSDVHSYNINYQTREIYLHGRYADEEPGVDYRMATTFVKNLHILSEQDKKNILVHMHTIGGEWGDGMAMFWAIRFAKSVVNMIAYAQASSMSGILLQAADKRILMPDCDFMIHHGSISLDDNSMAVKSAVDNNERLCKRMLQIFAERAIMGRYFQERDYSLAKVRSYLDRKIKDKSDWYLSPNEAVDFGFADGVLGEKGFETIEKCRTGRKYKGYQDGRS
jgi:ATP-dependent protease ClpP protease subunit